MGKIERFSWDGHIPKFDKETGDFIVNMVSNNKKIEIRVLKQRGRVSKQVLMDVFDLSEAKLKKVT